MISQENNPFSIHCQSHKTVEESLKEISIAIGQYYLGQFTTVKRIYCRNNYSNIYFLLYILTVEFTKGVYSVIYAI